MSVSNSKPVERPVLVSNTLLADYESRNVFPSIRRTNAARDRGSPGCEFALTRADARALLEDAIAQGFVSRGLPGRGLTMAYNSLSSKLERQFHWDLRYMDRCFLHDGTAANLDNVYADTVVALAKLGIRALAREACS